MNDIDRLNTRLGERLGYCGRQPRFAWKYAPEVFYYWRDTYLTNFVRQCWADQLGCVWVLCQFRRPEMTKLEWWTSFKGEFPYPDKGMYYAHPETALPVGQRPTDEVTAMIMASLVAQMSKSEATHLRECESAVQKTRERSHTEWDEYIADWAPAMDNWNSGKKSGCEFQVPGLKPETGLKPEPQTTTL